MRLECTAAARRRDSSGGDGTTLHRIYARSPGTASQGKKTSVLARSRHHRGHGSDDDDI